MIVPALNSAVCGEFLKPLILEETSKNEEDETMDNLQEQRYKISMYKKVKVHGDEKDPKGLNAET